MIDFSLYLQSSFSFNGSLIDIENAVKVAKDKGYKTLALTDYKCLHGAVKFYKSCLNHGIKPLIGLEVLLKTEKYTDLIILLYAKNELGYKKLMKLSSHLSLNDGFLEFQDLKNYSENLISVVVLDKGGVYQLVKNQNKDKLKEFFTDLEAKVDDFYFGFGSEIFTENEMENYLSEFGKLVIIDNVKYLEDNDEEASIILKKILRNEDNEQGIFEQSNKYFHLQDLPDLNKQYSKYSSAIKNSLDLISKCQVKIDFGGIHLPKYPLEGISALDKLKQLTKKGLERRLRQKGLYKKAFSVYKERLDHELKIISEMQYEDYFLIVWDFVLYAKKQGVLVGPGRGSAAGSLISYVLGITEVDPIEFNLYFERFLNPERITMPDIDMDFPDDKRDEVIRYVVDKYGEEYVASIITFGTFQGKSAIRDVGRMLDTSSTIIDDLTKKISLANNSIEQFKKENPKDFQYYINNPEIKQLMLIASKLVGLVRHTSTHAAGIIISSDKITSYSPIQKGLLEMYQTQYEASDLESLGLLKIDFLGIRNLTIIADVVDLIKENEGKSINIYKLPLDDKKTFKLLQDVKTLGIFQLESEGMMNLMREMQLDEFEDIATCISLHRPGPMENIPTYLRRRKNIEVVDYLAEDLIPILKPTHGIIVYQEQIMKIANKFAGYSLGEADVLRRAVSKKKKLILEKERKKFVQGVKKQGYSEIVGEKIYDYIVKFANYGFNKSHAVAYSYVAYWMAYLKANYPSYFLAVLLNSQIGSTTGTKKYIRECNKMGIEVLPPKINKSGVVYRYEEKGLRYPYKAIKGIGEVTAEQIVKIQSEGTITSFIDFYSRAKELNRNVIESLIYANVFSEFSINKKTLIENLDRIEAFAHFHYSDDEFNYTEYDEYSYEKMETLERELLGVNFEYHIINRYNEVIDKNKYALVSDILDERLGKKRFVGVLADKKSIKTKKDNDMAFVTIEDEFSQVDGVLFPRSYDKFYEGLQVDKVYLFYGKTEKRNSKLQVIIDDIREIKR
ncbi:MAG: DNA polymerase III subunit alpha [Candidatus Izimaplasma sp.]|nr:DNA polymerase III subunit alpha [Candidatus Izimaplasma bacterium]